MMVKVASGADAPSASVQLVPSGGSYNGVYTDVCGILGRDSQLVAIDCKAVAGVILNRKGNKVGDILARSGFRTQGDHVAACISDLVLVDSDRSEGGELRP